RYWVLGAADPREGTQLEELDDRGRLKLLEQAGWRVDYLDYPDEPEADGLPTDIALSNERLRASLSVSRWRL
ncbi:MAG: lipoprotein insertase outer membrane protein LolB, partial [Gammaproteobacteria bacterium]